MIPLAALSVALSAWIAPLGEVTPDGELTGMARRMEEAKARLEAEETGRGTQKMQEELLAELDRLILQAAPPVPDPKHCDASTAPKPAPGMSEACRDPKEGAPVSVNAKRPSDPGGFHPVETTARGWADLPPQEREGILQELRENYPPEYAEDIVTYFRQLALSEGVR